MPMSVEQIDVVEDLAAACEPASRATVGSVRPDPLAVAAYDPDKLHGFQGTAAVHEMAHRSRRPRRLDARRGVVA